ncbi:MAG: 30S ribosome-binding factor RbfA [Clostridia bacterium]
MANYQRTDRISEEIRKHLSDIIRELKDPRIPLMTSVVSVTVTKDLKYAKAYISIMGDEETKKEALKGLRSASGFIRKEIGARVLLRALPEFHFELDNSIEHGAHINELLQSVIKKEEQDND